jgi:two-component system OmpR family sensor kinase
MHESIQARWNSISLRTKITGVTVLMLTLGLLVSGVGTLAMLKPYLIGQIDSELKSIQESAAEGNISALVTSAITSTTSASDQTYVAVIEGNGRIIADNWSALSPGDAPQVPPGMTTTAVINQGSKVFTVKNGNGTLQFRAMVSPFQQTDANGTYDALFVAIPTANVENAVATYISIFLGFGIIVVIAGAGLTRMLVTTTFTPLRRVEETAAEIAEGDFGQRLDNATPNTEVGRLNRSLNTMLSRIDRAFNDRARTIEQMRRFVGDASHELRTPLVSVRGYAELYRMGALQTPEEVAQAMDRIEKEAIRMSGLVEDLLELARLDETKPLQLALVDLIPITRDAAMDAMASSPSRVVTVLTPPPIPADQPEESGVEAGVPARPRAAGGALHTSSASPAEPPAEPAAAPGAGTQPDRTVSGPQDIVDAGTAGSAAAATQTNAEAEAGRAAPTPAGDTVAEPPRTSPAGKPASSRSGSGKAAGMKSPSGGLTPTGPIAFAGATISRLRTRRPRRAGAAGNTGEVPELATTPTQPSERETSAAIPAAAAPEPAIVLAEENKIRQVVTNLMGNAMRFTADDSPIELRVQVDHRTDRVHLDIIDHGEGIPPQIRDKIFQRFWRADTSRARETGGSGLGLAIVSSIVTAHHGTVDVVDTPGGGATFRVVLPLAGSPDAPQPIAG